MERVVYILGAGFSAPAGLPVMANFLEVAKSLYTMNPDELGNFKKVFDTLRRLSNAKNYVSTDLFNIEEVFSVLQIEQVLNEGANMLTSDEFSKFIVDVIKQRTPVYEYGNRASKLLAQNLFGKPPLQFYGPFVAALLGTKLTRVTNAEYNFSPHFPGDVSYSVVTLNYDTVLESTLDGLNKRSEQEYRYFYDTYDDGRPDRVPLFKLHGCVTKGRVIPPTWSKLISGENVESVWKGAFKAVREATRIRILGYSLPESDTYIKSFLRAALSECFNLRSVDVLCRDTTGAIIRRFNEFFSHPKYHYKSGDIKDYLVRIGEDAGVSTSPGPARISLGDLEKSHRGFFA